MSMVQSEHGEGGARMESDWLAALPRFRDDLDGVGLNPALDNCQSQHRLENE